MLVYLLPFVLTNLDDSIFSRSLLNVSQCYAFQDTHYSDISLFL